MGALGGGGIYGNKDVRFRGYFSKSKGGPRAEMFGKRCSMGICIFRLKKKKPVREICHYVTFNIRRV